MCDDFDNNKYSLADDHDYGNNEHSSVDNHKISHPDKELHPLSLMSQIRDANFHKTLEFTILNDDMISCIERFYN